jgi:hypothetical protein
MKEAFKILVCILMIMAVLAEFGAISPSLKDNFLPDWMFWILICAVGVIWIGDSLVPRLKEICSLLKNVVDS